MIGPAGWEHSHVHHQLELSRPAVAAPAASPQLARALLRAGQQSGLRTARAEIARHRDFVPVEFELAAAGSSRATGISSHASAATEFRYTEAARELMVAAGRFSSPACGGIRHPSAFQTARMIREQLSLAGKAANLMIPLHGGQMMRSGYAVALVAVALVSVALAAVATSPAFADGALAVGSTSDVAKDGIAVGTSINYKSPSEAEQAALKRCKDYKPAPKAAAQCRSVGAFKGECYAVSFDPKEGTPGAGWAIASTKAQAEERAIANCQITAGEGRRDFCRIEESKCDEY